MNLKNNTMDKPEFIISVIVYACVSVFAYNSLLFVPIEGLTVRVSKIILLTLVFAFVTIDSIISANNMRNEVVLIANMLLPLGVYAFFSYWNYFKTWLIITLLIAFIAVVVVSILISYRNNKGCSDLEDESHSEKMCVLPYLKTVVAFSLCVFIIPMSISSMLGNDLYLAKSWATIEVREDRQEAIMANMNIISRVERWNELPINEKLKVLDCVKTIELAQLGVKSEVNLTADNLDENVFAWYLAKHNKIQMNITYLESRDIGSLFEDVIRECYHAYTYEQTMMHKTLDEKYIDLALFEDIKVYEQEFASYTDVSEYDAYTKLEKDTEEYVQGAFDDYWVVVNDWHDTKTTLNTDE